MSGSPCLVQRTLLRVTLAASLSAVALLVMPVPALAGHLHPAGKDSVDGGEIRYEDNTKYDGARKRAITAWNAVGRINIAPDNASHVCDLEIMDVPFSSKHDLLGWWVCLSGIGEADHLQMNTTKLDPLTPSGLRTAIIRRVMAHEFGHALGIADHYDSKWYRKALMYHEASGSNADIQTPLAHDREDYHDRW